MSFLWCETHGCNVQECRRADIWDCTVDYGDNDHDQPYAPAVAYKLATVIPMSSELFAHVEAQQPASLWAAYWRRREFNERRHVNPFPRIRLIGRTR